MSDEQIISLDQYAKESNDEEDDEVLERDKSLIKKGKKIQYSKKIEDFDKEKNNKYEKSNKVVTENIAKCDKRKKELKNIQPLKKSKVITRSQKQNEERTKIRHHRHGMAGPASCNRAGCNSGHPIALLRR